VYFYGAGGWSPERVIAESHAERWQSTQEQKWQRASELASQDREVFLVDETDPDWEF